MMDQQSAITYLLRRKEALNREIVAFRENLSAEIESVQKRLNIIPPAAYTEAQKLINLYKDVLQRLEGF
jgi:hypothetical protein